MLQDEKLLRLRNAVPMREQVGSICMQNLTHQKRLRVLCLFFFVVVVVVIVGFLPAGS